MILYPIQTIVASLLLMVIFQLLLKRTKSFHFNRFFILFALVFSITIPLLQLRIDQADFETIAALESLSEYSQELSESAEQAFIIGAKKDGRLNINEWLMAIYIFVCSALLIRFLSNLIRLLLQIKHKGELIHGHPTVLIDKDTNPFSFGGYLFLNRKEVSQIFDRPSILDHEKAHRIQRHSIDLILIELIHCFFWYNPIIWLYKKEMRINHEYLADAFAISKQKDEKAYLNDLLEFAEKKSLSPLVSGFSYQSIKKRINMNYQSKPSRMKRSIKLGLALFLGSMIVILSAFSGKRIEHPIKIIDLDFVKELHTKPSILPIEKELISRIASGYGMRYNPIVKTEKMHTGIDISAPIGTPILATADGEVVTSEFSEGYGNHIKIQHDQTYQTMYAHMASLKVKVGEKVSRGDIIGMIGNSGKSLGVHLHYEVHKDNEKVDPKDYFEYELQK